MRGTAQMTNKMNSIIIPHIEFRDTTIREAIDFLREQAAENDPSGQGVNIVLRLVPLGQVAAPSVPVLPPPADGHRLRARLLPRKLLQQAHPPRLLLAEPPGSAHAGVQGRLAHASRSHWTIFHLAKRCDTLPIRRD